MGSPILARDLPLHNQTSADDESISGKFEYIEEWRQKIRRAEYFLDFCEKETTMHPEPKGAEPKSKKICFADETGLSPRSITALRSSTLAKHDQKRPKSAWAFIKQILEGRPQT